MSFSRNGEIQFTGAGAAVMENPLNAIVFLANQLGELGMGLRAGEVVLSGSLSGMLPLKVNDYFDAEFLSLGKVRVRITNA